MIGPDNRLTIDLYHGTSTLFLDSIVQNGLGAVNPVKEWNLIELSKEVYKLSEEFLKDTPFFKISSYSFKRMTEQEPSTGFNFQHGDTYLSASRYTAANYAINKRYGSEILTYTIDFLKGLLQLDIPYVKNELFNKHSKIYGLIESAPSPLLIHVKNVSIDSLISEHGEKPDRNLKRIRESIEEFPNILETALQQINFRLIHPVNIKDLDFFLINVQKFDPIKSMYNFYKIHPEAIISQAR